MFHSARWANEKREEVVVVVQDRDQHVVDLNFGISEIITPGMMSSTIDERWLTNYADTI